MQCCPRCSRQHCIRKILRNVVLILLGQHCTGKTLCNVVPEAPNNIAQEKIEAMSSEGAFKNSPNYKKFGLHEFSLKFQFCLITTCRGVFNGTYCIHLQRRINETSNKQNIHQKKSIVWYV